MTPYQSNCSVGISFNAQTLRTTHEEAEVSIVYQILNIAQSQDDVQTIKVVSDVTDVFVLLMRFC